MSKPHLKVPFQFLNFAKEIVKCYRESGKCYVTKNQGLLRSCISRAYYAAFLIARYVTKLDYYTGEDVHRKVVETLEQLNLPDIADMLASLRRKRNMADYNLVQTVNIKHATLAVNIAEEVIRKIKENFKTILKTETNKPY